MTANIGVSEVNFRPEMKRWYLVLLAVFLLSAAPRASAQVCATPGKDGAAGTITGVVNSYYPGSASVAANATSITLGARTGASSNITSGDLLIVIQMQDASINSNNSSSYGDGVSGSPGSGYTAANGVGRYEFVKATNGVGASGGTLTLQGAGGTGGLINAYTNANATGTRGQRRFQVVRVPQYLSATLSSGLTALAWNGTTGGILALDVAGYVSLNNSTVSVAGRGFRGGAGLRLQGSGGANTDYPNMAPTSASTMSGFHGSKGEGIAGTPRYVWNSATGANVDTGVEGYPNGSMARGAPGNGGGGSTDGNPTGASPGGNDQNSGGGGGGNGGAGGVGGNTWSSNLARGGFGGVVFAEKAAGRVVMGGGGGAGTKNNDDGNVAASGGAAGGGIVIIRAGAVTGTGAINASGAAAFNDTLNDGGGGGGAGGSVIVLALSGNLSGLTVNATGGRGGDAWHSRAPGGTPGERHGPGGGGGGGVIFLSSAAASLSVAGGTSGVTTTALDAYGSTAGAIGATSTSLTTSQIPGVQPGAVCSPTDVSLISFSATRSGPGALLEWQTGYEVSNLGFNIYRERNGNLELVTPEPVAGSALITGSHVELKAGLAYSWTDEEEIADCELRIANCQNLRYWLEDIDLSGRTTMHGPFGVSEGAIDGDKPGDRSLLSKRKSPLLSALGRDASLAQTAEAATVPVEPMAKVAKLTAAAMAVQSGVASQTAVKLSIQRAGWYRVEQPELIAAGLPSNADPAMLQLLVDGKEVPMKVIAASTSGTSTMGGVVGGAGVGGGVPIPVWTGIEFYGVGIDSPSTVNHVYWLVVGAQPGLRIGASNATGVPAASSSFSYAVERRDKTIYFPALKNGGAEKWFGPLIYNAQPVDQSVMVQHVAPSGGALLLVSLQGFTDTAHSVRVLFNGAELGTMQFSGLQKAAQKFVIQPGNVHEGVNQIQLIGPPGTSDLSLVDFVQVNYSHTNTADNNALQMPATGQQLVTVDGFTNSNIRVMDVTEPTSPLELQATVNGSGSKNTSPYSVTVTAPALGGSFGGSSGARTLLAFASDQQKRPAQIAANQPSSYRDPGRQADYVIITRKDLLESFGPLADLRKGQNLVPMLIDIEDIYDEFGFGNKSPQALKDFLVYAKTSWAKAPRFVVLAGDATYDPKNYLALGDFDLVPTHLVETAYNEAATDDWFVDVNGDSVPDMAMGRLPVRTPAEAAAVVAKLVSYDASEGTNNVLLVADRNSNVDFEAADTQLMSVIPAGLAVTDIRRGQLGDSDARSQLLAALNQGAKVVNYYGHGSTTVWTDAPILRASDAAGLTNQNHLSLVVSMTCLSGYFYTPTIESLGESLLKAPGGAIAVWASSGVTDATTQTVMSRDAIGRLLSGPNLTIGEVVALAKASITNLDVRRTWILLGDPATRLR